MRGFMAGASSTRLSVASSTALARSLAWPVAIFAIRSAVAGATIITLARGRPTVLHLLDTPNTEDRETALARDLEHVAGADGSESIWQPEWSPTGDLVFASDRSG